MTEIYQFKITNFDLGHPVNDHYWFLGGKVTPFHKTFFVFTNLREYKTEDKGDYTILWFSSLRLISERGIATKIPRLCTLYTLIYGHVPKI